MLSQTPCNQQPRHVKKKQSAKTVRPLAAHTYVTNPSSHRSKPCGSMPPNPCPKMLLQNIWLQSELHTTKRKIMVSRCDRMPLAAGALTAAVPERGVCRDGGDVQSHTTRTITKLLFGSHSTRPGFLHQFPETGMNMLLHMQPSRSWDAVGRQTMATI